MDSYNEMFGISEVKPKHGNPYWLIRLFYKKRKPKINRVITYSGNREESLKLAKHIRDELISDYEKNGKKFIPRSQEKIRPLRSNRSGINGVSLLFVPCKKNGYFLMKAQWVNDKNSSCGRSFSVNRYGWKDSLAYAIRARREAEFSFCGHTIIPELGFIDINKLLVKLIDNYSDIYPQLKFYYVNG